MAIGRCEAGIGSDEVTVGVVCARVLIVFAIADVVARSEDYLLIGFMSSNFLRHVVQITITAQNGRAPFLQKVNCTIRCLRPKRRDAHIRVVQDRGQGVTVAFVLCLM